MRELEEHIARSGSSGQNRPQEHLNQSPLGGALFIGDEEADVPPTPHTSDTLLENQDHIGWPALPISMYFWLIVNWVGSDQNMVQAWARPCIPQRLLGGNMRATVTNQDFLRILWLIETHPSHRRQMVDFVSVEFSFALSHH